MADNVSVLTKGGKTYAKKRKAKKEQVEEIQFDPQERRSFLTGFHKRKVQRREYAISLAKQREREERLEMRRERREQKKEHLAQKILENKGYHEDDQLDEDSDGSEAENDEDAEVEEVLQGDSSVTTVTVTKNFDPTNLDDDELQLESKPTPQALAEKLEKAALKKLKRGRRKGDDSDDGSNTEGAKKQSKPKKKKAKKFRYETKAKRSERNAVSKKKKAGAIGGSAGKGKNRR
ncbi:hypothetical protein GGI25_003380 [Coemansia spiralis]|uniref:Nucleolar protein 12 n=2 Tax=Coemansia TaxID=4863 RepID=A0A9W8G8R3_9FUNG|nr:nucleolar protein 12-domain-containing protein [Coemansia spiralis]KAJ1990919.1 hypothetical protein EDC05_003769 [Coemansia umbellata]KAJ2621698.1 hypothetical protein GGI26_003906 [Coemansia sp. RSA 1358]KAJ2676845.1 hypothetical protein GGI25_003380 [Coemansia spiralis]